ncbi:hypothetical protein [Blastococcus sp. TF02A-26]|uniref:hypothetical protein n=1 Tax=Blastococcus sp. TF02A-26 TaxID=2250577 RepID=UPI000DEB7D46|nr:hypothetical protein [Blastococcus sp. TF02A-26]RBY87406.1 hypothetical protein DQ240_07390 [Blastococcus sp. TF02A-26]
MATALTEPIPAVAVEPEVAPAPQRVWTVRGRRWLAGLVLLVLAALPAVLGVRDVLAHRDGYLLADHGIMELHVNDVGEHPELLGAYSRFGWYHPGPMATYLLAVPYRLMDGASASLVVGTLVLAGISSVGAVLVVRRRAGLLAAAWALLVLTIGVRLLGAEFIRDVWNPYLPVLPFLLGVLLCWTAIRGDAWALPLAVVPMSLAVQSHVGYLAPVGAVGAVVAAGLLVRALRSRLACRRGDRERRRMPGRWSVAGAAAVVVGLVLWLPPIAQQIAGTPGNIGMLVDYLRAGPADPTLSSSTAVRMIGEEFGRLPAYVAGASAGRPPGWATAVGVIAVVVALGVAVRRRRGDALWLGALTLALAAAGVAALVRVDGPWLPYLTRWTAVVGVLAWITVGLALMPDLRAGVARLLGRRPLLPDVVLGAPLVVLATIAAVVTAVGVARAETPTFDSTDEIGRLEQAVVADLDRLGLRTVPDPPVVRVDFSTSSGPEFVVSAHVGPALAVQLVRDGVDVQVQPRWVMPFGQRYVERIDEAGYVVTVAAVEDTTAVPEPWQQVLGVGEQFQVFGGVPPVP